MRKIIIFVFGLFLAWMCSSCASNAGNASVNTNQAINVTETKRTTITTEITSRSDGSIVVTTVGKSTDMNEAYNSANTFNKEVSYLLTYTKTPLQVAEPSSVMSQENDGVKKYVFSWRCVLLPSAKEAAHRSFWRRGTFGEVKDTVILDLEQKAKTVRESYIKDHDNFKYLKEFPIQSEIQIDGKVMYHQEIFFASADVAK